MTLLLAGTSMSQQFEQRSNGVTIVLIATLLGLLLLSLAFNYLIWRWGDNNAKQVDAAKKQIMQSQNVIRSKDAKAMLMKAMLGLGAMTDAELKTLSTMQTGDQEMDTIAANFARDISSYAEEIPPEARSYPALTKFLSEQLAKKPSK